MSEIKNDGLDQYGAEPFEQKQFGTAGIEGVKSSYQRMATNTDIADNCDSSALTSINHSFIILYHAI